MLYEHTFYYLEETLIISSSTFAKIEAQKEADFTGDYP